jgi:aryl-alcohol dehydrogenase-like predicted oxidoreductase
MHYRKLGRTKLEVSEVGYGAWGIGGNQWLGGNDQDALAALRRALENGLNFIDTALAYGEGHSEQLVGRVLEESPYRAYVATKIPPMNRIWPARPGVSIEEVFPYNYCIECTDTSLRNLCRDVIDLQQFHVWNPEWLESDVWKRVIEDLKRSGKVRFFGVSINDHQPDSALGIIETGMIDTVQVIYNIFDQTPEVNLFPACRQRDIGVISRVPFDEGALTGRITEETEFHPSDFRAFYFRDDRKRQVVERVEKLCDHLEIDPEALPGIALRFILSNPTVSSVIPGMRSLSSVDANTGASQLGPLPETAMQIIREHAWEKNWYA